MTNVELLTIGDELLIGQVVNTNASWMGKALNQAGFIIKQVTSISDNETDILQTLEEARKRVKIILITGGLGPTKDDITKHTLCKYFKTKLVFNQPAYENLERIFKARGREVTATNKGQAEVPENCIALQNKNGTAPGMWFEAGDNIIVSMPGVPFEMKAMMTNDVIPMLKKKYPSTNIIHKTILTQGVGESFLSDMIANWEDALPTHMKLAYLPSPGMVRLRLTAVSNDSELQAQVDKQLESLLKIIQPHVYGFDEETMPDIIGKILTEKSQTLSLAESCTGGYVSHLITSVPGSSKYFMGSVISYDYRIKSDELQIPQSLLNEHGAVSEPVVRLMAENIRNKFKTDFAIATSGVAGPGGGTEAKPVGTVWIAVASSTQTVSQKFLLGKDRMRNIQVAGDTALNMLKKMLENKDELLTEFK